MVHLSVEYVPIDSIKPYQGNAKQHPQEQIDQIKASMEQVGFVDPIGVWNNEIVEGHGRLIAAQQLGYTEVPILRLEHMTDEERRAYTLIHNQLTANTGNDPELVAIELDQIYDIDMGQFGFDVDDLNLEIEEAEQQHLQWKDDTQHRVMNIQNLAKGQFRGGGPYDMPVLEPVTELPQIKKWIGFNEVLSDKDPDGKAVHFFVDDYQFERVWTSPEKYLEKLSRYVCVATPDFSPYGDMPMILQMYNHYRKHWVGAWLQAHGVTVIPTIRCSTDPRSLEWYLDGEPRGGIVMISSMWTKDEDTVSISKQEYKTMKETLKPVKIFIYGGYSENMGIEETDNVEYVKSFAQGRWEDYGEGS